MKAMILNKICNLEENKHPLELVNLPNPILRENEILVKISVCGVCHTELDEIEGRTIPPYFPVIPGHQVVGRIEKIYSKERDFAKELGASWAGKIEEESPEKLDCIIDTTPVWKPVVEALKNLEKGGRLVINAIRKEEIDKEGKIRGAKVLKIN